MHKFFQKKVKGKNIGQGEDARTHLFSVLGIIGSLSLSLCLWIGSKGETESTKSRELEPSTGIKLLGKIQPCIRFQGLIGTMDDIAQITGSLNYYSCKPSATTQGSSLQ